MKILVVIPAYNESENIVQVVTGLRAQCPEMDYVVVNDGSRDDTADICRYHGFHLIDLPINLGLAGAVQTGIKYALREKYDAVVQFDADGQHLPQYLAPMAKYMEQTGADIVIGSRFKEKPKPHGMRMMGSNLIQFAIKLTTGKSIKDPTSGMRMMNREMIREFAENANYAPEPDTISYLIKNGVVVEEFQVEMAERMAGESYLKPFAAIGYMFKMGMGIVLIQWFRKRK